MAHKAHRCFFTTVAKVFVDKKYHSDISFNPGNGRITSTATKAESLVEELKNLAKIDERHDVELTIVDPMMFGYALKDNGLEFVQNGHLLLRPKGAQSSMVRVVPNSHGTPKLKLHRTEITNLS